MKNVIRISFVFILLSIQFLQAQPQEVSFKSDRWNMESAEVVHETFKGKNSISVQGSILLEDANFVDGTIEFDMNFPEERNFPGVGFRVRNPGTYENFYVRPHQSGNPDANQYTPVFNGVAGWQLYHGEPFAKTISYTFDVWHHIKIEVSGLKAKIFFDDMETPLINIEELKTGIASGGIQLNGGRVPVHFANFTYNPLPVMPAVATEPEEKVQRVGKNNRVVMNWEVSQVVYDSLIVDQIDIDPKFKSSLKCPTRPVSPANSSTSQGMVSPNRTRPL